MEVSLGKYICCVGWAVVRGLDAENYEKRAILKEENRPWGLLCVPSRAAVLPGPSAMQTRASSRLLWCIPRHGSDAAGYCGSSC